ncbi:MAG: hypothetical protein AAGE52_41805 [Myxococcota bacterium]
MLSKLAVRWYAPAVIWPMLLERLDAEGLPPSAPRPVPTMVNFEYPESKGEKERWYWCEHTIVFFEFGAENPFDGEDTLAISLVHTKDLSKTAALLAVVEDTAATTLLAAYNSGELAYGHASPSVELSWQVKHDVDEPGFNMRMTRSRWTPADNARAA